VLLDERALICRLECSAAAESIHHVVEELARARGPKAFIRIYSAVPRDHFPLSIVPAGHAFRSCIRLMRTERAAVSSVVRLEREDDLRGAPSLVEPATRPA